MRRDPQFILSDVAGSHILVPVGKLAADFNGVVSLNDMGVALWNLLENDTTQEALLAAVLAEYEVTAEQAGARPDTWTPTAQEVGADPAGTAESAVSAHNQASDAHSTQFNAKANASDLTAHTGNKNNPHGVTAAQVGAAKPGDVFTVTLLASGWSEKSQTVNDERFVTSGYAFITNPADASFTAWAEAVIHGQDVTVAGQMTFTCAGDAPTGDITVKIIRLEATEA